MGSQDRDGDMTLSIWQAQYNGLLIGDGTSYEIQEIDGLDDLPQIRTNDNPRSRQTGMWPGDDYAALRSITLTVEVQGAAESPTFLANMAAFRQAFSTEQPETAFSFNLPSFANVLRSYCRPRKRATPIDLNYRFGKAMYAVQLDATDPRLYDDTLSSLTLPVAVPGAGFPFPMTFPLSFGTSGAGGIVSLVNDGNVHTEPVFTIYGPVQNPSVQNLTTGEVLSFGITLGPSDLLTVDTGLHSVVLNGTQSVRGTLQGGYSWWKLAPGTTQIAFRANTVYTGATMLITWRGANL